MIKILSTGNYSKANTFLQKMLSFAKLSDFDKYGRQGVEALKAATPKDSGETAASWDYEIIRSNGSVKINWFNTHVEDGVPIAVILQYGHATRNGGYVQGRDYINPALKPVFDKIAEDSWKEIKGL